MTRADQLPEDLEAERVLLSTLCAPGSEAVAGVLAFSLPEEAFAHPGHRCVWAALRGLLRDGQEVNSITLKDALDQAGHLGRVGGFNGLVDLLSAEEVGRPQVLVDLLRRKWNARRLIRMGAALAREAQAEERTPESLVMQLMTEGAGLLMDGKRGRWEAAGEGILEALQSSGYLTEDPHAAKGCTLRLGLPTLDAALKRLAGNLVVIAARPKCGKTTEAVKSAFAMAKAGHHVAFATLEMTAKELYVVLLAHALGITQDQAARGELTPMDWSLFMDLKETLDRIHIYPFDPDTAWPMVEACLRQAITTWNCSCCYLDYFGLVGKPEGEFFSEAARSAALSRRMKALPKQTGCIFVVLVQINRDLGDAGEPGPSNIRDTGQLEQDMAVGIFLWREPCKDPVAVQRGQRWEYFAKIDYNRFGPSYLKTGITLDGAHAQIHEVERTTDQRPDPAARRSRATQAPLNL